MGLCVFSLPISLAMIGCLIIIIKSEVWTIIHCLELGHKTMVCTVYLSIFLWGKFGQHWYSCNWSLPFCAEPWPWWRHPMMTSSKTFSALLAFCAGNSPATGEFPAQRPVTRSFGVFFDLRLNKRLSKQSWDWWFETPSRSLWRHCNAMLTSCQLNSECIISLWPSGTISLYRYGLKLAQIMVACLHQSITWTNVDLSSSPVALIRGQFHKKCLTH